MRFFVYVGFLLWLAATLLFRIWGDELINPDKPLIWLLFLVVPGMMLVLKGLLNHRKISSEDRPKAALLIAVPGMILDVFSTGLHPYVLPNLPESDFYWFSAWLLWAYSMILLGGLIGSKPVSKAS